MTRSMYAIGVSVTRPPDWRADQGPYESLFVFEMDDRHREELNLALQEDFWLARSNAPFLSRVGARPRLVATGLPELIFVNDLAESRREDSDEAIFRWGRGASLRPLPGRGQAVFRMLPKGSRPINGICRLSGQDIGLPAHTGERGLREEAARVGHLEFEKTSALLHRLADGRR